MAARLLVAETRRCLPAAAKGGVRRFAAST